MNKAVLPPGGAPRNSLVRRVALARPQMSFTDIILCSKLHTLCKETTTNCRFGKVTSYYKYCRNANRVACNWTFSSCKGFVLIYTDIHPVGTVSYNVARGDWFYTITYMFKLVLFSYIDLE